MLTALYEQESASYLTILYVFSKSRTHREQKKKEHYSLVTKDERLNSTKSHSFQNMKLKNAIWHVLRHHHHNVSLW
jgi:hypothetical protein